MRKLAGILFLLLLASGAAAAADTPKLEIFGGFGLTKASALKDPKGVMASVAWDASPRASLVFDIAHLKKDASYTSFLAGLQFPLRGEGGTTPFIRTLFGYGRLDSGGGGAAIGLGGGLDIRVSKSIAIRAVQFDYIRQYGDLEGNIFRVGAGIVFLIH